jgi:hypothetical protein
MHLATLPEHNNTLGCPSCTMVTSHKHNNINLCELGDRQKINALASGPDFESDLSKLDAVIGITKWMVCMRSALSYSLLVWERRENLVSHLVYVWAAERSQARGVE